MYCCVTIRLAVGVTAADTLLDLEPMLLTDSTDLQVRGVLIRGSLVQNGKLDRAGIRIVALSISVYRKSISKIIALIISGLVRGRWRVVSLSSKQNSNNDYSNSVYK